MTFFNKGKYLMKTFNETYLQMLSTPALIYEWNENLLLE
jgi:hypothetical protein